MACRWTVCLLAVGGLAACAQVPERNPAATAPAAIVFWRLEARVAMTGFNQPTQLVVTNESDFQAVWEQLLRGAPSQQLPAIDFARELVVVVGIGGRATGGYQLRIDSVRDTGAVVEVMSSTRVPGERCAVATTETAPVEVVRIPKVSKPITFTMRTWTHDCLE